MRIYEAYKCKREALGMTQAEFGKIIGVDGNTISRFENGYEVSELTFNAIKLGIENYIKSLDSDTYIKTRILEAALYLRYENDMEKLKTLAHMTTHAGKLQMSILKVMKDRERSEG